MEEKFRMLSDRTKRAFQKNSILMDVFSSHRLTDETSDYERVPVCMCVCTYAYTFKIHCFIAQTIVFYPTEYSG